MDVCGAADERAGRSLPAGISHGVRRCRVGARLDIRVMARFIYLLDEDTGKELERIEVDDWTETEIRELEHRLRARIGESVLIRDSLFDQD
jgi:hypothetical protein